MAVQVVVVAFTIILVVLQAALGAEQTSKGWWNFNGDNQDKKGGGMWDHPLWTMATTVMKYTPVGESISKTIDSVKAFPETLADNTLNMFSRIEAAGNALIGEIDGPGLIKKIKPILKLDDVAPECLNGLNLVIVGTPTTKVTMHSGYLNFDKDKLHIEGSPGDDDGWGTTKVLYLNFKFTDLQFAYEFITIASVKNLLHFGSVVSRKGWTTFTLPGTSSLNVRLRVPFNVKDITAKMDKGECFAKVREIDIELPERMKITDIGYDSVVQNNLNVGLTEIGLKKMVKDHFITERLKRNVRVTLKKTLEPLISDEKIFCDPKHLTVAEAPKCSNADITELYKVDASDKKKTDEKKTPDSSMKPEKKKS